MFEKNANFCSIFLPSHIDKQVFGYYNDLNSCRTNVLFTDTGGIRDEEIIDCTFDGSSIYIWGIWVGFIEHSC